MKRRLTILLSLVFVIMVSTVSVAFAGESMGEVGREAERDNVVEPRSLYLASAISEITNEGEGVLGIYADFSSYYEIPWAKITINLERRKGTSGSWSSVKTYVYEFTPEDDPDGTLHAGEVEFSVYGLATNYYFKMWA